MHHGTCVTHVPWCMPGPLTSGFFWSRWRGRCSRHSRLMRNPQYYVSVKTGPMSLIMICRLVVYHNSTLTTPSSLWPYHPFQLYIFSCFNASALEIFVPILRPYFLSKLWATYCNKWITILLLTMIIIGWWWGGGRRRRRRKWRWR